MWGCVCVCMCMCMCVHLCALFDYFIPLVEMTYLFSARAALALETITSDGIRTSATSSWFRPQSTSVSSASVPRSSVVPLRPCVNTFPIAKCSAGSGENNVIINVHEFVCFCVGNNIVQVFKRDKFHVYYHVTQDRPLHRQRCPAYSSGESIPHAVTPHQVGAPTLIE